MKSFVLTFAAIITFSVPMFAYAVPTGVMFGGYVTGVVPCTCSVGEAILFSPFFTGLQVPSIGALYYAPFASLPLPYFNIGVPTTWHLGVYTPGAQACFVGAPPACAPFPTYGTLQYFGTSIPGASPTGSYGFGF